MMKLIQYKMEEWKLDPDVFKIVQSLKTPFAICQIHIVDKKSKKNTKTILQMLLHIQMTHADDSDNIDLVL